MAESSPIYLDSALVAKFYLNEPGRDVVRHLAREAGRVVASAITKAEVSAAFHRKLREGSIENTTFKALQGQFAHDITSGLWTLVPVTDILLEDAQTLFTGLNPTIYLRSLDALHLVTAKAEKFDRLYSNDRRLLDACSKIGFDGVNPV